MYLLLNLVPPYFPINTPLSLSLSLSLTEELLSKYSVISHLQTLKFIPCLGTYYLP